LVTQGLAETQLLEGLNDAQREAVAHRGGPLLVLAGAGSGKTRVLTHRIGHLVATGDAAPERILAITFTNKAAAEMRQRVFGLVGSQANAMWLSTFHSACARILRVEGQRLGYTRDFSIFDSDDSRRLIKRCIEDGDHDVKRFPPRLVQHIVSTAKNRLLGAEAYAEQQDGIVDEVAADVYQRYERRLRAMNAMDFDDLLLRTVELLQGFPEVLERLRNVFRQVLVDEYQDTNHVQYRLLELLATEHRQLCVVGDDDQSIYGFRGADIRNILEFEQSFPDAHVVKLEQNYRSTNRILKTANTVVARNHGRKRKELWTDAGEGDPIQVRQLPDEHTEARFVVAEIEQQIDAGRSPRDVAVFYRTNAQSRVLEDALRRYRIEYDVIGGTRFYERAEIKDAVAYLTLLANPSDEVALRRVINVPRRGIGATTLGRLLSHANTIGEPVADLIGRAEEVPGVSGASLRALTSFGELIAGLREREQSSDSLAELIDSLLDETGYRDALKAESKLEGEFRLENLAEFVNIAVEFERERVSADDPRPGDDEGRPRALSEFLQQIALFTSEDEVKGDEPRVTLMTLHNAKGLEYPVVFIIGCEDGVFPHSRAIDAGDIEEERRLCYVGITRARERLYLTYANSRSVFGDVQYNQPSRFLEEIPEDLVEFAGQRVGEGLGGVAIGGGRFGADRGAGRMGNGRVMPPPPSGRLPLARFKTGDDVQHASFGEGVVLSVEPGNLVVVRFASDGSERKFMADYAPLTKRI
jgi:DNA helicase-2/ATP-dependent DNA helicase PcrA